MIHRQSHRPPFFVLALVWTLQFTACGHFGTIQKTKIENRSLCTKMNEQEVKITNHSWLVGCNLIGLDVVVI